MEGAGWGRVRLANAKQNRQTTADSNSMVAFEVTTSRYPASGGEARCGQRHRTLRIVFNIIS